MLSTIKKVQIMLHLLIIEVDIPANAQMFFSGLLNLVTFNMIDLSEYIKRVLHLIEPIKTDANSNLENLGYNSIFFIINMGNLLIVIIGLVFLLMVSPLTKNIRH